MDGGKYYFAAHASSLRPRCIMHAKVVHDEDEAAESNVSGPLGRDDSKLIDSFHPRNRPGIHTLKPIRKQRMTMKNTVRVRDDLAYQADQDSTPTEEEWKTAALLSPLDANTIFEASESAPCRIVAIERCNGRRDRIVVRIPGYRRTDTDTVKADITFRAFTARRGHGLTMSEVGFSYRASKLSANREVTFLVQYQ